MTPRSPEGEWADPGYPVSCSAAFAIALLGGGSVGSGFREMDTRATSNLLTASFTQHDGRTLEKATSPAHEQKEGEEGHWASTARQGGTGFRWGGHLETQNQASTENAGLQTAVLLHLLKGLPKGERRRGP